jgi:hypothetical protein
MKGYHRTRHYNKQQQPARRTWQNNSAGSDNAVGADLAALLDHCALADQTAVAHSAGRQQRAVADGHL